MNKTVSEYPEGKILLVKIKSPEAFDCVFGADCFLENFPKIKSEGILVKKTQRYLFEPLHWYVFDDGKIYDTCFFTDEEMEKSLSIISEK